MTARSFLRQTALVRNQDGSALLVEGALVSFFEPGTSTPIPVYAAATGGGRLAQPIRSTSTAEVSCWADLGADQQIDCLIASDGSTVRAGTAIPVSFAPFTDTLPAPAPTLGQLDARYVSATPADGRATLGLDLQITVGNGAAYDFNTAAYASPDLAVQAAVDSIPAGYSGGSHIFLKKGIYDFVGGVDTTGKHNVKISGAGWTTQVRWKNSNVFATAVAASNWLFKLGDYCTITDIQLQGQSNFTCPINGVNTFNAGTSTNTLGAGIKVAGGRTWVDRVYISGMAEDGVTCLSGIGPKFGEVGIIGCGGAGLNIAAGGPPYATDGDAVSVWIGSCNMGISLNAGGWSFTAPHVWGCQVNGIYLNAGGNRIVGGYIENNGQWGIYSNGVQGNIVTGCDIWANGVTDPTIYGGMALAGASHRNVLVGNRFRDNQGDSLSVGGTSQGNVIIGNTVTDSYSRTQSTGLAKSTTNGVAAAGSTAFTVADNSQTTFSQAYVNKRISITGAGPAGATLITYIAAYVSPTQVTLAVAASTDVSPATFTVNSVLHQIREVGSATANTYVANILNVLDAALGQLDLIASTTGSTAHDNMGVGHNGWVTGGTTTSATFSIVPRSGRFFAYTLDRNLTSVALFGTLLRGQEITVVFTQDATGSRTVSGWSSTFTFAGGTAPVLSTSPGKVDLISFVYDGSKMRETSRVLGQ